MKRIVKSAELIKYNANSSGNSSPDCVKRAISYAFDVSYIQVSKDLNQLSKENGGQAWNTEYIFNKLIRHYGGTSGGPPGKPDITVEEFADEHPKGSYILDVGKHINRAGSHLVAVVDGEVIDSWDSREWYVKVYWDTLHVHKARTNINSDESVKELVSYAMILSEDTLDKLIPRWEKKLDVNWECDRPNWGLRGYKITLRYFSHIIGPMGNYDSSFEVPLVLTPTMDELEAKEYIAKTLPTRLYDRLYAIADGFKKALETFHARQDADAEGINSNDLVARYRLDGRERKFYDSLPGWAKARCTYLRIWDPGQYSDSYEIELIPLDRDDPRAYKGRVSFNAWESWQIRDELKRYKEKNELPGHEYHVSEDY